MGLSNSSLSIHPPSSSLKDKTNVLPFSERTMISQVSPSTAQPLQQPQRVRFNYKSSNGSRDITSKTKPPLLSPLSSVDHDTFSTPSKPGYRHPRMSCHDEHLFVPSKTGNSQAHNSPVTPVSQLYSTPSTLTRLQSTCPPNGSDKAPRTYITQHHHSLPRRGLTPVTDSANHKSSMAPKSIHSNVRAAPVPLSRVDTAETRNRSQETSATRIVIKSSSRSTMDSSKASSSGALSSRDVHFRSSSRPDHKEVDGHVNRRRTGEDIKLKPIHEVEIGDHCFQNNASHLPSRPPGLTSNRNSATSKTETRAQVTVPTPPVETLPQAQTRRISRILARSSAVVLSPHINPHGSGEISVEKQNGHQVNAQDDGPRRGSSDVATKGTSVPDSKGVDREIEQTINLSEDATARNGLSPQELSEGCAEQMEQEKERFLPLPLYLSDPDRLSGVLQYLSFSDWCSLFNTSKEIRLMITQNELLREEILEYFLGDVGYCRWCWREPELITISLTDMFYYLKTASRPTQYYVEVAQRFLKSHSADGEDDTLANEVAGLAQATRSYNRLVLRLRTQSEMLENCDTLSCSDANSSSSSRKSCPIPDIAGSTSSFISSSPSQSQGRHHIRSTSDSASFSSPLYRPNRAASLRVFVPSPRGEWLSDASVLECEAELKRAELTRFMKLGDVVWDIALGDEKGNSGRLIWDGCYLLDLDYSYSSCGDIPRHIPSLALPPSYFHGIIQRGPLNVDPVIRMDVSPWGDEIARNLQLMQDKMVAETPQGLQNVVRWLHRTTFTIRPPSIRTTTSSSGQRMVRWAQTGIPIRDSNGQTVHSSWYGSIVIETDGTNECLDDLKERCGLGVFPQRTVGIGRSGRKRERHDGMVWRILRDKSRPGEIWIKVITPRERLM